MRGAAHRSSQEQEQQDAWAAGKKRPKLASLGWALIVQRLETLLGVFTEGGLVASSQKELPTSQGYKATPGTIARSAGDGR